MLASPVPMTCASSPFAFRFSTCFLRFGIRNPRPANRSPTRFASASAPPVRSFQWDDALRIAEDGGCSDLSGFFQRVRDCNRGWVSSVPPVSLSGSDKISLFLMTMMRAGIEIQFRAFCGRG